MATDSEVADLDLAFAVDEDVGGLDVTMDHTKLSLQVVQGFHHLWMGSERINIAFFWKLVSYVNVKSYNR